MNMNMDIKDFKSISTETVDKWIDLLGKMGKESQEDEKMAECLISYIECVKAQYPVLLHFPTIAELLDKEDNA